ncbi:MAG: CvpA family protein [Oscillospiraceae bacterium]|nr:CvpA family protein [Oscillospiraceae bacterium]
MFDYSKAQEPSRGVKNRFLQILINLAVTALVGFVYFYLELPALSFFAEEFYIFIGLLCLVYIVCSVITSGGRLRVGVKEYVHHVKKQCLIPGGLLVLLVAVFLIGSVLSWPILRAGSYQKLIQVESGDFTADVAEISFDKIPLLDAESAMRLGDRKLGELADMVSQFEVADDYTQINFQNRPVRVTPLIYGDLIKWFNNRSEGLPAYLIIDMVTQNVEVVRLSEGMKYSPAEHFGRYLYRHLRFRYPTYLFATPTFEIDEDMNPYWICPRVVKRVGLFGGEDVKGAVLINAITGESEYLEEVPSWVDRVYPAELITKQYDYYGYYRNGFFNSILGQKDVTVTTSGYNYIALNDDVYMYTGITSVGGDQSNIGFILSNQRTKETKFYPCAGATEYSAMSSAEGVVQHLGYDATFPLLLNISDEPTYFVALKDNARLVKTYAMVNVQQYQVVATGATPAECEREYVKLLSQQGITVPAEIEETQVSGVIVDIRSAVIGGNTVYYLRLENDPTYYAVSAAEHETAVILNVGQTVTLEIDTASTGTIKSVLNLK